MATLVLTVAGTALGGPIGGAIGAYLGQQVDQRLFGPGPVDGPRLKELTVTTSTYGQPIPRHFGRMRVAGTVIWATDLVESSETQGGKGKPKVTTYSYAANFAVALSSTPIQRIGRIWADGNLLRGSAGDLKVEGEMRAYLGHGDAQVDPLIAADKGSQAPAFRDCAYVVFENLQLADFGNRIPALTFEIFSQDDASVSLKQLVPDAAKTTDDAPLANTRGFSDEGGPVSSALSAINRVFPLSCATTKAGLRISSAVDIPANIPVLPEQLLNEGNADTSERHKRRAQNQGQEPLALRYYDEERDYQPGVQRAIGLRPNGRENIIDLPATMTANGAKALANDNAHRARWQSETITWRIGELDPSIELGGVVRLPDTPGIWRVVSWEWYDQGIELQLQRLAPAGTSSLGADTGIPTPPLDLTLSATQLKLFEVPPEDTSNPASIAMLAAVSSNGPAWFGASLFKEQGAALIPIASSNIQRAICGNLAAALAPSPALLFEPQAEIEVQLIANDLTLFDTDIEGLAAGANRLLIGSELVQFLRAESLGDRLWRLRGLLRGRAGTEEHALSSHPEQTSVVVLDDRLTDLSDAGLESTPSTRIAAIGRADADAVFASLQNAGLSRRPPTPVHPRVTVNDDSSVLLCWLRRARGQWRWDVEGDIPLVEETEKYLVGYGPVSAPFAAFSVNEPQITISQSEQQALLVNHGPADLWVRQVGTYKSSNALFLTTIN